MGRFAASMGPFRRASLPGGALAQLEPTGSPALRHSAATACAACAANAPGASADAHVDRATAPHWWICSAPVAAGIVA